jgi:hypothetical protein
MIGVRISALSGLHVGATWYFTSGEFTLGGSSTCSAFICDDDFPEVFLTMRIIGRKVMVDLGVTLEEEIGELRKNGSGRWLFPDQKIFIEHGDIKFSIEVLDTSGESLARIANFIRRVVFNSVETVRGIGIQLVFGLSFAMGMAATVTVLFFGTSNVSRLEAKTNGELSTKQAEDALVLEQVLAAISFEINKFITNTGVQGVNLSTKGDQVNIAGAMSRKQLLQFEGLLTQLTSDYGHLVGITAKMALTTEQVLIDGLEIMSVSLGEQPVVVLRNGQKLFIGSDYETLKLVGVNEQKAVFSGGSTYEIPL